MISIYARMLKENQRIMEGTTMHPDEKETHTEETHKQPAPHAPKSGSLAAQIEESFTYHKPDEAKIEKITQIRSEAKKLAHLIDELVPAGRDKSLAITHLEDVERRASAGIVKGK